MLETWSKKQTPLKFTLETPWINYSTTRSIKVNQDKSMWIEINGGKYK